jgi:hypothetical protein
VPHRHAGVDPHHADGCARERGMSGLARSPSAGRRHITRDTDEWARCSPRKNSEVDPRIDSVGADLNRSSSA